LLVAIYEAEGLNAYVSAISDSFLLEVYAVEGFDAYMDALSDAATVLDRTQFSSRTIDTIDPNTGEIVARYISYASTNMLDYTNPPSASILFILDGMAGSPNVSGYQNYFSDVDTDSWYANAAMWSSSNQIFWLRGGLFRPYENITRSEMAFML